MTYTGDSRTGFKSCKSFMMPSTACASSLFVTSTDSGSRSDSPYKRSCSPGVRRARFVEENRKPQVLKPHLGHPATWPRVISTVVWKYSFQSPRESLLLALSSKHRVTILFADGCSSGNRGARRPHLWQQP